LLLFLALGLLSGWPVLVGEVPLPAESVTQFPPWESVRPNPFLPPKHAEMGDLVTQFYPWRAFAGEAIRSGVVPLWNPHIVFGIPFVANAQSAVFYPPNLLYALFPTPVAWAMLYVLRTVLAAFFTYCFIRLRGGSKVGATAGGIIFAFSGFLTSWSGWPHVDTAIWLPAALCAVCWLRESPGAGTIALAALLLAMPVLAGHPETAIHLGAFVGLYALHRARVPKTGAAGSSRAFVFLALFSASAALALVLSSVQLLPTLEWIGELQRTLSNTWGSRPSIEILNFVYRDIVSNPNSAGFSIPEGSGYAGIATLVLAPLAYFHNNRRDVLFFTCALFVALAIIYGWEPFFWLSHQIPLIRGLANWRLLFLADFCLAVLAGLGASALVEALKKGRTLAQDRAVQRSIWRVGCIAFGVVAVAIIAVFIVTKLNGGRITFFRGPLAAGLLLLAMFSLLAWFRHGRPGVRPFSLSLLFLLTLDLLSVRVGHIPFVSPDEIFPATPVFEELKDDTSLFRVAALDAVYRSNFGMMYDLSAPGGYDIRLRSRAALMDPLRRGPHGPISFSAERVVEEKGTLLDLLNVKYLVTTTHNGSTAALASHSTRFDLRLSRGSVSVFENRSVLPRAFLVPANGFEIARSPEQALERMRSPSFDPRRSVIVEHPPELSVKEELAADSHREPSRVESVRVAINEVVVNAEVAEPSFLVLSQGHYPGWKVYVDEREASLLKVNHSLVAVLLPVSGYHSVRFSFEPLSYCVGLGLSVGAALFIAALAGHWLWKRRADSHRR
jgi:hypothetical protein